MTDELERTSLSAKGKYIFTPALILLNNNYDDFYSAKFEDFIKRWT